MAGVSDLINFKRGTSAALQTLISNKEGTDGCFYLTVDDASDTIKSSSRLYVGRSDGSIVPVNQGIYTVTNVSDLAGEVNGGKLNVGDFAYVTNGNILAIYSATADGEKQWIQINPQNQDHYLSAIGLSVATSGSGVSVTTTGTVQGVGTPNDSFTITGAKGISVTGSNKAITITGDEYELSSSIVGSDAETMYATVALASDNVVDAGSVDIKGGSNVTISGSDDEIVINAVDTYVSSLTGSNEATGFGFVAVNTGKGNSGKGTIDPVVAYGENGTETAHFLNGTATLDIYSKTDIDAKVRALDAMVYRGTIGEDGDFSTTLPELGNTGYNISIGNTFKVVGGSGTIFSGIPIKTSTGIKNEGTAKNGDVLIANSTSPEGSDGAIQSNLYYSIIPSGDEIDTTYSVTDGTNGIIIHNVTANQDIGSIRVAGDDSLIIVTPSGTTNKTLTVSHNTVTTTTAADATTPTVTQSAGSSVTVVTALTDDGHGHITDVTTKNITFADPNLQSVVDTVSASSNVATISTAVNITGTNATPQIQSGSFKLASDNITITVDENDASKILANFRWGSF